MLLRRTAAPASGRERAGAPRAAQSNPCQPAIARLFRGGRGHSGGISFVACRRSVDHQGQRGGEHEWIRNSRPGRLEWKLSTGPVARPCSRCYRAQVPRSSLDLAALALRSPPRHPGANVGRHRLPAGLQLSSEAAGREGAASPGFGPHQTPAPMPRAAQFDASAPPPPRRHESRWPAR